MSDITSQTTAELQTLLSSCTDVLTSVIESLEQRPDIQEAIRQLMTPGDALEAFSAIGVAEPDLARVTLQAAVAALVNAQSIAAIESELARRAANN